RAQGNPVRALEFSDRAASPTQLPHEGARCCEHLNAVVPRIGHVDQAIARKRETQRTTELAGAAAGSADAGPQPAAPLKYADSIRVVIGNVDKTVIPHEYVSRVVQNLAVCVEDCRGSPPDRRHE